MGGSILGAKAIYDFLNPKSKNFLLLIVFQIELSIKKTTQK